MRTRQGTPDGETARSAWLAMAELSGELEPASCAEFASFMLVYAMECDELHDEETAESLQALSYAIEVLDAAGF